MDSDSITKIMIKACVLLMNKNIFKVKRKKIYWKLSFVLAVRYAEMDIYMYQYIHTALTGLRTDMKIFQAYRKPPEFQGEPLRPRGELE